MKSKSKHLNDDEILWTLVESKDHNKDQEKHLMGCKLCHEKQTSINNELNQLGTLARQYAPKPRRSLRPVLITQNVNTSYRQMKKTFVYVVMFIICIGGVFGMWPSQTQKIDSIVMEQAKTKIDSLINPYIEDSFQIDNYSILPNVFKYIIVDDYNNSEDSFYDYFLQMEDTVIEVNLDINEQTKFQNIKLFRSKMLS